MRSFLNFEWNDYHQSINCTLFILERIAVSTPTSNLKYIKLNKKVDLYRPQSPFRKAKMGLMAPVCTALWTALIHFETMKRQPFLHVLVLINSLYSFGFTCCSHIFHSQTLAFKWSLHISRPQQAPAANINLRWARLKSTGSSESVVSAYAIRLIPYHMSTVCFCKLFWHHRCRLINWSIWEKLLHTGKKYNTFLNFMLTWPIYQSCC